MKVGIVNIGDELLIGQVVNTNASWLGEQVTTLGGEIVVSMCIGDAEHEIVCALEYQLTLADLVIITGGLGPTNDDVTKHVLVKYFKDELIEYSDILLHIQEMFQKRNVPFSNLNASQAMLPKQAEILKNEVGTASGMWYQKDNKYVVSLPGVPYEMKWLMENKVLPKLPSLFHLPFRSQNTFCVYGVPESELALRLAEFENELPQSCSLAYLPSPGLVKLRLTVVDSVKEFLDALVLFYESKLLENLSCYQVEKSDNAIIQSIQDFLINSNSTLAVAESCTGGGIANEITSIPGVSKFFKGGVVAYQNAIKEQVLGVKSQTIVVNSVVSAQVALEMAKGVQTLYQSDYAMATTGNAGPSIDDTSEEVGVVYIALVGPNLEIVEKFNFGQPREKVIKQAIIKALQLLKKNVVKNN